ncbi:MAG: hypothetical protein A2289_10045, partial [Deltaproteobacteria bacterium RIFOXYA12_FULL_58_15]
MPALAFVVLTFTFAAPPEFIIEGGLEPGDTLAKAAKQCWRDLEQSYSRITQSLATPGGGVIRIVQGALNVTEAGKGRFGRVTLRQRRVGLVDEAMLTALRHELAHQFLMSVCPQATDDRLFHEAFALATSGEIEQWTSGEYLSTPRAQALLERSKELDAPSARRALARLLVEGARDTDALPIALTRRLRMCAVGGRWAEPVSIGELSAPGAAAVGNALVILNRHSGEVLRTEGMAHVPMPFGSTLKPFVVAGAGAITPHLQPVPRRPEWLCGDDMPAMMDVGTALLRSCNGYFLDWAQGKDGASGFGTYGALLIRLGLERLPEDMSEAIGIRPTLALSPWAVAQAFRVLAAGSPEVIELLKQNAERGTLGTLKASSRLAGVATKTGTVRDSQSRPTLGWIAAVTDDLVVVRTCAGRAPRTFAGEIVKDLQVRSEGQDETRVQTFGLLSKAQIEASCDGVGVVTDGEKLTYLETGFLPLVQHVEVGSSICVGAPWLIRFPTTRESGRPYAGIFRLSPLPPPGPTQEGATKRQQRARRGSEIVFSTSRARYVAGVINSEDASIRGEARVALGAVIAHNAAQPRHGYRPLCDTTHCQVFQGTHPPLAGDDAIFEISWSPTGWLHFARGGTDPWRQSVPRILVDEILGANPIGIAIRDGRIHYSRTVVAGGNPHDEVTDIPCDLLRSRLRLPSCPEQVEVGSQEVVFFGRGQGHGVGLDVEWAKQSGLDAKAILEQAY